MARPPFSTLSFILLAFTSVAAAPAKAADSGPPHWGSYSTPFAADSPWNSRPLQPQFGTFVIPKSNYFPSVAGGPFSTGVFLAQASDTPMTIHGANGKPGVWDPDTYTVHDVTLPHWPASVIPASGADGHADIVDPATGIVHSFWQLKQQNGSWVATQYAWTRLDGSGWGDPAHYFQGARAAGVAASAGIIRRQEIDDGQPYYRHALAMSLTFNALASKPAYIYPATSADNTPEKNTGQIPEGALLMLPPSYDTRKITVPALRKVAETLKRYGAYVVDRNFGTPFYIYVENGAPFNLHQGGWNNDAARGLDDIRANLRQVVGQQGWIDGNDKPGMQAAPPNLLSLRGQWRSADGPAPGQFDSWRQALVFGATGKPVLVTNTSSTGLSKVSWAAPAEHHRCRFTVSATGGARLRLQLLGAGAEFDSGLLANGASRTLACPGATARAVLVASSGVGRESSVRADLRDVGP